MVMQQKESMKEPMTRDLLPFVSVVAPCRNEIAFIKSALQSLLACDYPADRMEILVVDGMSDDGTRRVVAEMAQRDPRIRLLDNPKIIVPCAMNIGIRQARGEYIVRVDCHARFAPDYISKSVAVSRRTGAGNVGGYMVTLPGDNTPTGRAIATATSCPFGVGNSMFRLSGPEREVDTLAFGTYPRDVFDQVGLFDERLIRNQDVEMNRRIRRAGRKVILSPEVRLEYYNRSTYVGLWRQSFNNGLWNPYTVWLVGTSLSWRHFAPMGMMCALIAFMAAGFWRPVLHLGAAIQVALYLVVGSLFAVRASRSKPGLSTLRVLWAFVVMHAAYGLGSLWGVMTIPFKYPRRSPSTPTC